MYPSREVLVSGVNPFRCVRGGRQDLSGAESLVGLGGVVMCRVS